MFAKTRCGGPNFRATHIEVLMMQLDGWIFMGNSHKTGNYFKGFVCGKRYQVKRRQLSAAFVVIIHDAQDDLSRDNSSLYL